MLAVFALGLIQVHRARADGLQPAITAMPTTSPAGWTQIYAEDFLSDVLVGGFTTDSEGRLTATGAGYKAYGSRLTTYPDGWFDTNKKAKYYPSKTMSVSNSCLDIYLHTEEVDGVATALSATVRPILPNPPYRSGQIYGRFSARMRVSTPSPGYGGVWLLWQDTNDPKWPAQGEVDFPEGGFAGKMHAYAHYANPNRGQDVINTTASWTDWHIVTTEWLPGSLKFYVDGAPVGASTNQVPSTSMHYMFQCGAADKIGIDPVSSGHVQIDWIVIEKPLL